jgi:hypothetical protein
LKFHIPLLPADHEMAAVHTPSIGGRSYVIAVRTGLCFNSPV